MEMLYEDLDKLTAVTHLCELSLVFSNLSTLIENGNFCFFVTILNFVFCF